MILPSQLVQINKTAHSTNPCISSRFAEFKVRLSIWLSQDSFFIIYSLVNLCSFTMLINLSHRLSNKFSFTMLRITKSYWLNGWLQIFVFIPTCWPDSVLKLAIPVDWLIRLLIDKITFHSWLTDFFPFRLRTYNIVHSLIYLFTTCLTVCLLSLVMNSILVGQYFWLAWLQKGSTRR